LPMIWIWQVQQYATCNLLILDNSLGHVNFSFLGGDTEENYWNMCYFRTIIFDHRMVELQELHEKNKGVLKFSCQSQRFTLVRN
jgi:hypothetical protein